MYDEVPTVSNRRVQLRSGYIVPCMPTPSFSSFPLSFNSFPDIEGEYGSSSGAVKDLERSESGHGDSRRKKDKDKGYRHERTKERNEKTWHKKELRSRSKERVDIRSDDKDEHLRGSSRLFYQDHKGDSLNVTYGGLHTGDVPRYRLVSREYWLLYRFLLLTCVGGRKVLGLEGDWSVMHRGGKGIVISNDRFNPRVSRHNNFLCCIYAYVSHTREGP